MQISGPGILQSSRRLCPGVHRGNSYCTIVLCLQAFVLLCILLGLLFGFLCAGTRGQNLADINGLDDAEISV